MSLAGDVLDLIERIYAAGVEPTRWRDALRAIGTRFDACAGVMYTVAPAADQWSFSAEFGTDPKWQAVHDTEFCAPGLNPIYTEFRKMPLGGVAPDWALVPKKQLLQSRLFNEWAKPQGFYAVMSVVTASGPHAVGGLSLTRG